MVVAQLMVEEGHTWTEVEENQEHLLHGCILLIAATCGVHIAIFPS